MTRVDASPYFVGDVEMLVDGSGLSAEQGWIEVESPRDGSIIGRVPRGGDAEVAAAVAAARGAFREWRDRPSRERGKIISDIATALVAELEHLARISSLENGNALRTQTRGEAAFLVDCFRYFGGLAQEAKGETIPIRQDVLDYSRREPLGVVGAIIPWNAPLMLAAVKIAPALVMGNTMVMKVAEDAPFAVLELSRICQRFLPPGVLNIVTGYGREAGEALTSHPDVAKLSFTGSTGVGRRVMEKGAERIVPVSLELGGKSPQIVFPDADEDWVVQGVIAGMRFFRQGQSCTAGSRLFVHRDIFESFTEKLVAELTELKVGDPLDETSDMGSIVNQSQYDKICAYIEDGLQQPGARLLAGGVPGPEDPRLSIRPTVIAGVDNSWRLAREEIFGPVVVVIPWSAEDEVVEMANDSHYGLAAFIWSKGLGQAVRTAHRVEAGWVQVNQGGGQALGQSYGGYKQSGIGREFSLEGMVESYTQQKHVSVNLAH
ncbi:aldehyde dehydrogenase family protein [Rhodococcus sp. ABRD24]|uniref:aldehyde dehydrogenase family protein n=1 Tax=Rhodococcus sp. ABRD24 TaxID=2507582 RepID=UPI0010387FF0|nr:aldehyde dehydrogenase family protein [Rhodococcus sp. ABRD24]QBJ97202.1 aldehyde dehydrogenase family protein [Rhodococcus sp. ABRD24]